MSRSYYIIDSIKGGCGKTTFSIMLAALLQSKKSEELTCLLDLDLLGTGMIDLFLNPNEIEEYKKNYCFLSERIRNFRTIEKKYIYSKTVDGIDFHFGFSDTKFGAKSAYSVSSEFNYTPVTSYGVFRNGLKSVLDEKASENLESQLCLIDGKTKKGHVKNVIMDMAPGMDPYSEVAKGCIFDKRHSSFIEEDSKRYYFLMMGMNQSHIVTARNYLEEFINNAGKSSDKIFIVINDIQRMAEKTGEISATDEKDCYNAMISMLKNELVITSEIETHTYFLALNYYEKYTLNAHLCKPLGEISGIFDPSSILRFWATWDKPTMQTVTESDLKSLFDL